jgi:hypothetical protein
MEMIAIKVVMPAEKPRVRSPSRGKTLILTLSREDCSKIACLDAEELQIQERSDRKGGGVLILFEKGAAGLWSLAPRARHHS